MIYSNPNQYFGGLQCIEASNKSKTPPIQHIKIWHTIASHVNSLKLMVETYLKEFSLSSCTCLIFDSITSGSQYRESSIEVKEKEKGRHTLSAAKLSFYANLRYDWTREVFKVSRWKKCSFC